ncbi:MAG TPA: dihydropteroate synthase [Rickettsiales bacterium]|nr:dihydropteroate synthase [Rickettsiales bacterium]
MTKLVGILNVTPDSFSDGGRYDTAEHAIQRIDELIACGAAGVDVGAESTRPGAVLLSPEQEWHRLAPIMEAICERAGKAFFSVDTRQAETALRCIRVFGDAAPSSLAINDVSGGRNAKLVETALKHNIRLILTHSLSVPADPAVTLPQDADALQVVYDWAEDMIRQCGKNIIIDPGIGFGKNAEQSLSLIKNIGHLKALGVEIMGGHSRKSFLSLFTDKPAAQRDPETLIISQYLVRQGVDYLRVHDVKSHYAMLKINEAL